MLAGTQTLIFTATNVFLDLLSSPRSSNYYLRLRDEVDSTLRTSHEWESQTALAKLHRIDSSIRESLRRSPILTRTGMREVVKKDGVRFPNGQMVPRGAWLAAPAVAIHYDERFFPDPEKYAPFRFTPRTAQEPAPTATAQTIATESQPPDPKPRGLSTNLSTASPTFLGFGYGRHSWYISVDVFPRQNIADRLIDVLSPGRWFVALQLKLLVAYVVSRYDIEALEQRPLHRIVGSHFVPPSVDIKVRRRRACP